MRKSSIWLIITAFIVTISCTYMFMGNSITVTASSTVLTEQGLRASLSVPLKKDALNSDHLYVSDQNGKRVNAKLSLSDDGRMIHVEGLNPGSYTLHVGKGAVKEKWGKAFSTEQFHFTVQETIESVATEEELKAYFEQAKNRLSKMNQAETFSGESHATVESSDMANSASGGSADHSTTNNQVEGIDEADLVKTDGNYIYSTLGNEKVVITDIRNPKKVKKATEIKMEEGFYPSQLFLHEQTLIVLGDKYEPYLHNEKMDALTMPRMNGMTMMHIYSVENPEKPKLVREIGAEGYLNGARKTGDLLYVVTNVQPNFWIMEELDGDVLRPHILDSEEGEHPKPIDYKDIAILPGAMEPSYSVITAIDLSSPKDNKVVTKGYLGSSEQLYMTKENLYLTATIYEADASNNAFTSQMIWNPGNANSEVFKFALDGTNVKFHSSATLKGHLLNQFSMDEHHGHLRVVTTEGNMWDDKNPSKNHLFILDEKLKVTGSVEGLAKGERIYSARFMGDKAYMVTFRETDPLFVIDVADPAAPKVLGELKIPGFSNYLHPLDENHLIGFGYETVAEKNPGGDEPLILTMGMKISLFDVTDFANPKEKDTENIGGRGTYSPIQYDHRALFQHKERNLYGFPVVTYDEIGKDHYVEYQGSGALVYEITPEKGIVLKGDLVKAKKKGEQYGEWEKEIQRLLYSKDELYTLSMKEIQNYSLDTFAPIGSVSIE